MVVLYHIHQLYNFVRSVIISVINMKYLKNASKNKLNIIPQNR